MRSPEQCENPAQCPPSAAKPAAPINVALALAAEALKAPTQLTVDTLKAAGLSIAPRVTCPRRRYPGGKWHSTAREVEVMC